MEKVSSCIRIYRAEDEFVRSIPLNNFEISKIRGSHWNLPILILLAAKLLFHRRGCRWIPLKLACNWSREVRASRYIRLYVTRCKDRHFQRPRKSFAKLRVVNFNTSSHGPIGSAIFLRNFSQLYGASPWLANILRGILSFLLNAIFPRNIRTRNIF